MLYDAWQKVIKDRGDEVALRDLASGQSWTFAQMDREAQTPLPDKSAMIFPQGHSPEFIFTVLRAWRRGRVVCPLEAHHRPLAVPLPPPPCCHLKTTPATTGVPRAVAFTEAQLMADARNIVTTMGLRPEWPNLGVISLAYSYGFSNLVLPLGNPGEREGVTARADFIPTFTGRLGYAWDTWLLYAKGGYARIGDSYTVAGTFTGTPFNFQGLDLSSGWTVGAGLEKALWGPWSVRLEYDYFEFGQKNVAMTDSTLGLTGAVAVKQSLQTVRIGLNFHPW